MTSYQLRAALTCMHTDIHRAVSALYLAIFIVTEYVGIVVMPGVKIASLPGAALIFVNLACVVGMFLYFGLAEEWARSHAERKVEAWRTRRNLPRFI